MAGRVEERGVTKAFAKVCPCQACKKARKEPNAIFEGVIESYSARPVGGWQGRKTNSEYTAWATGGKEPWYMGVELETMAPRRSEQVQLRLERELDERFPYIEQPRYPHYGATAVEFEEYERRQAEYEVAASRQRVERRQYIADFWSKESEFVTPEELVSMAAPEDFWLAKHDGSVTGPEFASQPATLDYWYSIRPELETMFTTLLHAGARSHAGDEAGMHINISVKAFDNADHLVRFTQLINLNANWSRRMSQRTQASANQWCRLGSTYAIDRSRAKRWADNIMRYGSGSNERYVAVNGACGDGRIEFRLPRGTLRIDRFYKNLEWVHAMIEFTRMSGDTKAASFMRWVMSRNEYPDLRGWLTDRFGVENLGPYVPVPAPQSEPDPYLAAVTAVTDSVRLSRISRTAEWRAAWQAIRPEPDPEDYSDPYPEPDPEPEPDSISLCDCAACADLRLALGTAAPHTA